MEPNGIVSEIRVLVVDDNEDIRQSIGTILSENGCRCESAKNDVEAIQIARRNSLEAVVTDLEMPEMDGIDLTKELSRLSFDVPVMIMTGHSDFKNERNRSKTRS